jgi:hypothetical protein
MNVRLPTSSTDGVQGWRVRTWEVASRIETRRRRKVCGWRVPRVGELAGDMERTGGEVGGRKWGSSSPLWSARVARPTSSGVSTGKSGGGGKVELAGLQLGPMAGLGRWEGRMREGT